MNRTAGTYALSLAALSLAFGVTAAAQSGKRGEKPTKEFQDVMRSNTTLVGVDGRGGAITGALSEHLKAEDYDAILKDAAVLKGNFAKIEAFWTERKVADAIGYSKAGIQALADIETAAKAKDKLGVARAELALATACRNCHQAHRVHVLMVPLQFEIR